MGFIRCSEMLSNVRPFRSSEMAPPYSTRLHDILQMMDEVEELTAGLDFSAYAADFKVRRAVERCIEIVSEASRHIPPEAKAAYPEVPWPDIAAIGNIFRHEYQRVADPVVWYTATRSLPELRWVVFKMLEG